MRSPLTGRGVGAESRVLEAGAGSVAPGLISVYFSVLILVFR